MSDESTTDVHAIKRRRRETAMQFGVPTAAVTVILGLVGGVVRNRDVERIETRLDRGEAQTTLNASSIIELKADSRNSGEKLDRMQGVVDQINVKIDSIRDRLPR